MGVSTANPMAKNLFSDQRILVDEESIKRQYNGKEDKWFKTIFENSPLGIVVQNASGNLLANKRFCDMLGYEVEELQNFNMQEVTHPDDLEAHKTHIENSLNAHPGTKTDTIQFENRYLRKNGSVCWAEVSISLLKDKFGKLESTFALIKDMNDRKEAEERLTEREHFFSSVFNESLDAFITINKEMEIIKWNPQAEVIFGYTKNEMEAHSLMNLIVGEGMRKKYQKLMDLFLANQYLGKYRQRREIWMVNKAGTKIPIEYSISPIKTKNDYIFSICIRDIHDRVTAQQSLKDKIQELDEKNRELKRYASSNSQLENFAYVASHDLREPLRTIGNFTQLLEKRLAHKIDDTDREFFDFIVGGVKNMNNLINDLLTYSRVNTQEHTLSEIMVGDALYVILHSLDTKIKETDTKINLLEMPKEIVANKTKFKQIFQNLIANAIKFRKPGQPVVIDISGHEEEGFWHFKVKDNGIGIKEEFHMKIFELFKKLHSKSEYQGSGIGLAVCKRIVEQHGGVIKVESTFGEGTTFCFSFAKTP